MYDCKYFRKTELDDLPLIYENLKGNDLLEVEAHGYTAKEATQFSFLISKKCYTMLTPNGEPAGLFGISEDVMPEIGNIWALTTDKIYDHPVTLHKVSKRFLSEALKQYPLLSNLIWEGNTEHLKWLRSLGFIFLNKIQINNNNFYEFVRT